VRCLYRLRGAGLAAMRVARLVQALVAGTLLAVATSPPAEAQRGPGKGRGRQPAPAPTEQPTPKDQPAGKDQAPPKEELGPGEYPDEGFLVREAVNRGEGPQALAYYEKTAQERRSRATSFARHAHWGAAATVAQRLGRYQKSIQ
jgi:hypothetical protein